MVNIPGNVEWVYDLIPDLSARTEQYIVDTDELDDELIEVFIEEIIRLTGELQEGLEKDDSQMLQTSAHSIKGMGGTIGLPEISVLGLEIELLAKNGRLEKTRPLIDALVNWLATF